MTPADREEVERGAMDKCDPKAWAALAVLVAYFLCFILHTMIEKVSDRISALETQVKELKEARR